MRYLLLFCILLSSLGLSAQENKIVELERQLMEYRNAGDDQKTIETALVLKKEYKANNISDTASLLFLDAVLCVHYNNTLQYAKSKEIYQYYFNCTSCEKDQLTGLFISMLGSASTSYIMESDFIKALELNSKIVGLIQNSRDPNVHQLAALYINERAEIMMRLNELDESERLYDLVISNTSTGPSQDLNSLLKALSGKSDLYDRKNDFPGAIGYTYQMIDIYERNQDSLFAFPEHQMGYCKSLLNISQHFTAISDLKNSLLFAEKLVETSEKFKVEPYYMALAYSELGEANFLNGDTESGEKAFDHALGILEQSFGKDSPYLIQTLSSYALYLSQQNFPKSISLARRGIRISEASKENFAGTEDLYSVLSTVYTNPGYKDRNLDSALYYARLYQESSKKNSGEYSINYISSFDKIAKCYVLFHDYGKALPLLEEYKDRIRNYYGVDHSSYRYALSSLMISYNSVGDIKKAEIYGLEVMSWWNNYIKKNYLSLVGTIHQNREIIGAFEMHLAFVLDNITKLSNPQSLVALYDNQLLIKNLQLSTNASLRNEAMKDAVLMEKLQQYFDLKAQSGSAETQLQLSRLESELYASSSAFKALQDEKIVTSKDVSSALKPGEVAIEFVRFFDFALSGNSYVALILRPNNPVPWITWLGTEDSIELALKTMDLQKLYQHVWKHIPEIMPQDTKTIYLSPVYALNNVPFHALCQTKDPSKIAVSSGSNRGGEAENTSQSSECVYLMDQYELHLVSSTRVLLEKADPFLAKNSSILSVGGVDYNKVGAVTETANKEVDQHFSNSLREVQRSSNRGSTTFDYLKGTDLEVEEIGKLVKKAGWKETSQTGELASENKVKDELSNGNYGILHFATHGFSFPEQLTDGQVIYSSNEDPLDRCGLVLAGGNLSWTGKEQMDAMLEKYGEDGILTGKEVVEMPLGNTRLVVLSACKTGIGKIEGIEGSFSVNRAFLLAGVDYVISSLWSVPDKETMELMTIFYKQLTTTRDIEASFAAARLEMRKRYPHNPTAWAGFVLVR